MIDHAVALDKILMEVAEGKISAAAFVDKAADLVTEWRKNEVQQERIRTLYLVQQQHPTGYWVYASDESSPAGALASAAYLREKYPDRTYRAVVRTTENVTTTTLIDPTPRSA